MPEICFGAAIAPQAISKTTPKVQFFILPLSRMAGQYDPNTA
jgi:hypothetical protein